MIYLVNTIRVISTKDWNKRNPDISVEQFAKQNDYKVVNVNHDENKPVSKDDFVNGVFKLDLYEKRHGITQAREEIKKIQIWFNQHDWIPNKIITGEWEITDPRWTEYLSQRQQQRLRQDELKQIIGE